MLPAAVREALEKRLHGTGRRQLAAAHAALSQSYRGRWNSSERLTSDADALSYAVGRMPATFASVSFALEALADSMPGLSPATILDAGCGPGTATIAAAQAFPSLRTARLIDRNRALLQLAHELVPAAATSLDLAITIADLDPPPKLEKADLVMAAYVMVELSPASAERLAQALWGATGQALVLTEPGTPEGFNRLRRIREMLLAAGAHAAAPCTHQSTCPMPAEGWCRTPVRLQRTRDHRALKDGARGYEDEPLAYLALTRAPVARQATHRIIGPVRRGKVGITAPACGSAGMDDLQAPARNRELFKRFKRLDWGDAVEIQIQGAAIPIPE